VRTKVSRRAQTVVPAEIRRRHNIKDGDMLEWIDDGQTIKVVPVPADALEALRGSGKGQGLARKLLQDRTQERRREA